jgi:hypothetical protein
MQNSDGEKPTQRKPWELPLVYQGAKWPSGYPKAEILKMAISRVVSNQEETKKGWNRGPEYYNK